MTTRMQILTDSAGLPRPDMDAREVTLATMAEYMGVSPDTLYRRILKGQYDGKRGIVKPRGCGQRRFIPRIFILEVGEAVRA